MVKQNDTVLVDQQIRVSGGMTTEIDAFGASDDNEVESIEGPPKSPPDEVGTSPESEDTPSLVPLPPKKRLTPLLISGIVTGGLGLGGVAVGVIYGVKALDDKSRYKDADTLPEATKWEDKYNKANTLVKVGFIAGGTLVAAGVVLIAVDVIRQKKSPKSSGRLMPHEGSVAFQF
ncbi:MAG: hypothetical protein JXR76_31605 [Deltaproteobacteria bacterium]|nr:hypothetical protein [Deltaproteobacteria bacterium]